MTTDEEMRRLAEAATGGPWSVQGSRFGTKRSDDLGQAWGLNWRNDLAFIAAAREKVPELLDRVAAAEAEIADAWAVMGEECKTAPLVEFGPAGGPLATVQEPHERTLAEALRLAEIGSESLAQWRRDLRAENAALRATVERQRRVIDDNDLAWALDEGGDDAVGT